MKITTKFIATKAINKPARILFSFFLTLVIGFGMSLSVLAKDNLADVVVKDAWVRTTVPGQKGTGAFMSITAKSDLQLVGASSAVAGVVEVHEMKMVGDVMQMRAMPSLDLPAGKAVMLRPGGFHVMLMDLKAALPKDSTVPLTLLFKNAQGVSSQMQLTVSVQIAPPQGASPAHKPHKH
jgi:copper(I)-binding protein